MVLGSFEEMPSVMTVVHPVYQTSGADDLFCFFYFLYLFFEFFFCFLFWEWQSASDPCLFTMAITRDVILR